MVAVGVDAAAARPCGRAADDEPVRARLDPYADRAEALGHRVDAVGLLRAQLRGATDDRLAVRERAEQRDQRQLVDEARHLLGLDGRGRERRGTNLQVRHGLARDVAAVEDRDARAHPLQYVEQP